jgi:hypothetical protein
VPKQEKLVPLKQFLSIARIGRSAVKPFEEMRFITPHAIKNGASADYYYSLDEAKIISTMMDFLTGEHGKINLRQARGMALAKINARS